MSDVKDTRESVDAMAAAPSYSRWLEATAMLLRLLSRAEAAEQDRDAAHASAREAHYDACRTVERCLVEAKAAARADALREAAAVVFISWTNVGEAELSNAGQRELSVRTQINAAILALIPQEPPHAR